MALAMKRVILAGIIVALLSGSASILTVASAGHEPSVLYGAYCRSPHGAVHKGMDAEESIALLAQLFRRKGLSIRVRTHGRRFVRADIFDGTDFIDSIILDTRTGRMRSVY